MSTGLIIAIVVVVLILVAVFAFVLPRARRNAEVRARERELEDRRAQVADRHRTEAGAREREAEMAESKAQLAQADAEKQRAEAQMQKQRAEMHERGMADDELVADHEREHFAPALDRDDRTETGTTGGAVETPREGGRAHEPAGPAEPGGGPRVGSDRSDYEQGRVDERESEPRRP
jgi:FtsZ-interacting cell division protein ZipA